MWDILADWEEGCGRLVEWEVGLWETGRVEGGVVGDRQSETWSCGLLAGWELGYARLVEWEVGLWDTVR